jgi:hypothetical protein
MEYFKGKARWEATHPNACLAPWRSRASCGHCGLLAKLGHPVLVGNGLRKMFSHGEYKCRCVRS